MVGKNWQKDQDSQEAMLRTVKYNHLHNRGHGLTRGILHPRFNQSTTVTELPLASQVTEGGRKGIMSLS